MIHLAAAVLIDISEDVSAMVAAPMFDLLPGLVDSFRFCHASPSSQRQGLNLKSVSQSVSSNIGICASNEA